MELLESTLGGLLEKWAAELPDHEFMVYPDRNLRLTYAQFDLRVNNLAKGLGISEDLKEACALIAKGKFRKLDLGYVKVGKKKKFPFFELVTVGLAVAVYPDAQHVNKGHLSSIVDTVQTFLKQEPNPKITVKMDGDSNVTVETMLALVAAAASWGASTFL